jgi:hypothetical protein
MLKPKEPVRRFDVFAEYSRQEALKDGLSPAQAKGYGVWLAKVVAARRFGRSSSGAAPGVSSSDRTDRKAHTDQAESGRTSKWRSLSGVPQTDRLFTEEIVNRMGADFYRKVVVPAIRKAIQDGQTYTQIRDAIRKDWKP